jgi:hypothetical protein
MNFITILYILLFDKYENFFDNYYTIHKNRYKMFN